MKRSLVWAILGTAASLAVVNSSQAEGFIIFNTYANGFAYAQYSLYGGPLMYVPDTWHASIWYALGNVTGSVTPDPSKTGIPSGGGLQLYTGINAIAPMYFGLIDGSSITIPGYTSGSVTFVVGVFDGADYASSTIRGHSLAFTEILVTGSNPQDYFHNMLGFDFDVPEPSAYAVMGLGAMSLLGLRFRRRS